MQIEIEVTQEDIDSGFAGNCLWSPIALASRRAMKTDVVQIRNTCIIFRGGRKAYLPENAKEFVKLFDIDRKWVRPFKFTIETTEGI